MPSPEILEPEGDESSISVPTPTALAILSQSEHAAMVQTANLTTNRRKLADFDRRLTEYSTHSLPVAMSMFYTLPRAGKQIIGASVRFAEVVAPCWKNCSTGSRMVGESDNTVTAQGIFIDYESNLRNVKEIPRKITDKEGKKYNPDMILTTSKAALSIAYREAVLKGGVPAALWGPAYDAARDVVAGKSMAHSTRVDQAMEYIHKMGVTEWQILNSVGVASQKDLETDHLVTLRVLCEEIKKGVRTIEEVFGSPYDKEIEALFVQLKKNETEKRLLRESYMGRAKDLLDYLRSRVTPAAPSKPIEAKQEPKPEPAQETAKDEPVQAESAPLTEQAEPPRRGPGRPSKAEVAAREAAKAAQQQEQPTMPEVVGQEEPSDSFFEQMS